MATGGRRRNARTQSRAPSTAPPTAPPSPPAPPSTVPATVMLSGVAQFESVPSSRANGALLYNAITAKPIRGATVEILVAASGQVLAMTETDATGAYSVFIPPTDSVRVRVRAQLVRSGTPGWDFRVRDDPRGNGGLRPGLRPPWLKRRPPSVTPAPAGMRRRRPTSRRAPAECYAILDAAYEAHQKVLSVAPNQVLPPLNLFWSVNNRPACCNNATGFIGTSHFSSGGSSTAAIYILGQANADTDEYDTHVVVHEFRPLPAGCGVARRLGRRPARGNRPPRHACRFLRGLGRRHGPGSH